MKRKNLFFNIKGLFTLLMSVCVLSISAQNITVTGTVTDDTGMSVIGAAVVVAGNTSYGTREAYFKV